MAIYYLKMEMLGVGCLFFILFMLLDGALSRATNCVIPSLCNDAPSIDPKSSTVQGGSECPTGYVSCTNVKCGISAAQPTAPDGPATKGAFPWIAFLQNYNNLAVKNGYAGAGVLIDQNFVLTAAHKVADLTSLNVIMGVYDSSNMHNTQTSKVSSIYVHSKFDSSFQKNDIALLQLATPINLDANVNQICLPPSGTSFPGNSSGGVVSGWGQTSRAIDELPTVTLKQVHVPIVDAATCKTSYTGILGAGSADQLLDFPNEICGGGESWKDACNQDGGSPLSSYDPTAQKSVLAALVIWGKNCGQANILGVYLNVPSYIAWIQCTKACMLETSDCAQCPSTKHL